MTGTAETKKLSKLLFNAQHRLSVAAVFAPPTDEVLSYEDVASRCEVSRSVAHKELQVLVRIRAVLRVEIGRTVHYQRLESEFWPFFSQLIKDSDRDLPQPPLPPRVGRA